jgi:hypothetical protein
MMCKQYIIKKCRGKGVFEKKSEKVTFGGVMSEKKRKLWVRIVCGVLATMMIASCLAILVPFL